MIPHDVAVHVEAVQAWRAEVREHMLAVGDHRRGRERAALVGAGVGELLAQGPLLHPRLPTRGLLPRLGGEQLLHSRVAVYGRPREVALGRFFAAARDQQTQDCDAAGASHRGAV